MVRISLDLFTARKGKRKYDVTLSPPPRYYQYQSVERDRMPLGCENPNKTRGTGDCHSIIHIKYVSDMVYGQMRDGGASRHGQDWTRELRETGGAGWGQGRAEPFSLRAEWGEYKTRLDHPTEPAF